MTKAKRTRNRLTKEQYLEGILKGDRFVLSKAITLIESTREDDRIIAKDIIRELPKNDNTIRIGITGVPGVGKSTFIESFGHAVIDAGYKLAVLTIDPSSRVTRGSILGDKTRMENLSRNPHAYIRPSAAGTSLGGVANKTRETMLLCEAAGFDMILIETVGVGQSETMVKEMVDFFLLLMLSGAGDELQGIKKGIMEMADMVTITKADGDNIKQAQRAKRTYKNAMHLFPPKPNGWVPKVTISSALKNEGMKEVLDIVIKFIFQNRETGYLDQNRRDQHLYWLNTLISEELMNIFYKNPQVKEEFSSIKSGVLSGYIDASDGKDKLLDIFFRNIV
ncbi:methylmalonyl Co-A mutase-associated GTPase MeaB [Marinigracilibium pacificum]|uniref:Methylmalonyl Co-A mutase-associated GTPase MeaB n=1 Tax=Marinigracilibium pacificum TaxID=2729599 RepID=A0A848IYZ4_9BACT|nr:methylmalonyl Co-A mutase-associated GTPase MeaB [Marinigracilibium pacificum]NMM49497.1 methylmalonyl Co-A mutase-associated GTPase MeaB [Marinigracilibium pacificum]